MLQRLPRAGLVAVAALLVTSVQAAEVIDWKPDPAARAELDTLACRTRHDVPLDRIEGRAYGPTAAASVAAEVHCASHGVYQGSPMHYVVQCARSKGSWSCQGEWNEILVVADADRIPVRIEGDIPVGVAHQTIHKLATSGSFQGYSLRKALAPPCYLHKGQAQEFMDVKCEGWHIVVSMWCPQSDCPRVFSIARVGS